MKRSYIKHTVVEIDEEMIQRCVICGEIIADYRNAMFQAGTPATKGWPAGDIFVSKGFPTIYLTTEPEGYTISLCTA